jgi:site-specific DNA-cytosine methylase
MPVLLELFSGTGSIGKAFRELGWDVFSVDIDPKGKPSLVADVKQLMPEQIPYQQVDFIWASPPCTQYSIARTNAKTPRDLEGSDALAQRTLDLIEFYKRPPFVIENPFAGLLKTRAVVRDAPMRVVDYCKYGTQYRKRTALWTNTNWEPARPLCKYDCEASRGRNQTPRFCTTSWTRSPLHRRSIARSPAGIVPRDRAVRS